MEITPEISVIIPVKNAEYWLKKLYDAYKSQTLFYKTELIFIDSQSTDNSVEIINSFEQTNLYSINAEDYNHGETRNFGATKAKGKYLLFTVQDAEPENNLFLENIIKPFQNNRVVAVCGRQIVQHKKTTNPALWHRQQSQSSAREVQFSNKESFLNLSPTDKKNICGWDNVCAIYKNEILEQYPFKKLKYGEDAYWVFDILKDGLMVAYTDFANVFHFHYENPNVSFKRMFATCYLRNDMLGYRYKKMGFKENLVAFKLIFFHSKGITVFEKIKWLWYNITTNRAINKAIATFNNYFSQGQVALDKKYEEIFAEPPISTSIKYNN